MQSRERYRSTNGLTVAADEGAQRASEAYARALGEGNGDRRVVAHIDLDGFYAAVERRRLGRGKDAMIAVSQWGSLIAVDYNCRPFGVKRGMTVEEATKLCPQLECVHVEVITCDANVSSSPAAAASSSASDKFNRNYVKVSLARYRQASFEVLAVFEKFTKKHGGIVQRASIDESYIDLTDPVDKVLRDASEEVADSDTDSDLLHFLDIPTLLKDTCVIGRLHCTTFPLDLRLAVAAQLVSAIRKEVCETLGFTVSAGLAPTKLLAKIGSSRNKPNKQTLVPVLACPLVLRSLPLRGIPGLGGKAGKIVEEKLKLMLRAPSIFRPEHSSKSETDRDNLQQRQNQQKRQPDDNLLCSLVQDVGERVLCEMFPKDPAFGKSIYRKCLGLSDDKVEYCVRPKSLLSMKSLRVEDRVSLNMLLLLLAQDLVSRLREDQSMFRRRAKTLVVHHRTPGSFVCVTVRGKLPRAVGGSHSGTGPSGIPDTRSIVDAAIKLMESRLKAHSMLPCSRMGLSAETFEDLPDEKAAITNFFSAKAAGAASGKLGENQKSEISVISDTAAAVAEAPSAFAMPLAPVVRVEAMASEGGPTTGIRIRKSSQPAATATKERFERFVCPKCNTRIRIEKTEEHADFHFAQEVQGQLIRAEAGGRNPQERLAAHARKGIQNKKRKKGSLFAAFAKQEERRKKR